MMPESVNAVLPYFCAGTVVKGFGRGSKQLGCPTANLPDEVVAKLPPSLPCGVYYGFAKVEGFPVEKSVMSLGWNPHFKNTKKTLETHVIREFPEDFYGSRLKVVLCGFLREMKSFSSLDELIDAIRSDIAESVEVLSREEYQNIRRLPFFADDAITSKGTLNNNNDTFA